MHKKKIFVSLLIITLIYLVIPVGAKAESEVSAMLSADLGEFTVGDPVPMTLAVTHPAGHQVILPQLEANWGDFTIHSQSAGTTESNPDGTETTSQEIDARLFAPGTFTTMPLSVTVSDSSGQLREIVVDPVSVTIASVLVEGDSELRDIKPQAALPYSNILPWVIGFALLVLVITGAYFWHRRRQAKLALVLVDNRLPHEVALDELERVESLNLPRAKRFKEHYTLISDCIRIYMEKTFKFPVRERTTREIKNGLKRSPISHGLANQFVSFLDESDLVKFSKFTPDAESAQQLLAEARTIVENTNEARSIVENTKPVVADLADEEQDPSMDISSGPGFGKNDRNQKAEVTA
jgi:hypothetical protein